MHMVGRKATPRSLGSGMWQVCVWEGADAGEMVMVDGGGPLAGSTTHDGGKQRGHAYMPSCPSAQPKRRN